MTNGIFHPRNRHVKVILNRVGTPANIKKPNNPGENKYGKVADTDRTFTTVAIEDAYRSYGSYEERPQDMPVIGGDADMDTPRIIFQKDTAAKEGYQIEFTDDNRVYELDRLVPRETHQEFRATIVNG